MARFDKWIGIDKLTRAVVDLLHSRHSVGDTAQFHRHSADVGRWNEVNQREGVTEVK